MNKPKKEQSEAMPKTVSELAREWKCSPTEITSLFYRRILSDERCPVVSGRRLIPESYLPTVKHALAIRGKLPGFGKTKEYG